MLAIIIPYYKLAFFEVSLQSLANQTDKRFKVYIGDDASPEDCSMLLLRFEGKFDFKYHRFQTNLGSKSLSQQWERCIDLIDDESIEWLMVLGDDDILEENVVEAFYRNIVFIKNKHNVIRYSTKLIFQTSNEISNLFQNPKFEKGLDYIEKKINKKTRGSLSEFIFNKKAFYKFNFCDYNSGFYSDDKLVLDLALTNDIYSINESFVTIRISDESLSGKTDFDNTNLLKARHKFYLFLIKNHFLKFHIETRKTILESVLFTSTKFKKKDVFLFISLLYKVSYFRDYHYFFKILKKMIKILLRDGSSK